MIFLQENSIICAIMRFASVTVPLPDNGSERFFAAVTVTLPAVRVRIYGRWFIGGFSEFAYEAWMSSGAADAGFLSPTEVARATPKRQVAFV